MVITISNNKGGVLKTTLATNIACELSEKYKVCLIDFDGQSNIANTFKTDEEINKTIKYTLIDYLLGKVNEKEIIDQDINEYFRKNDINSLNIIYSNHELNQYDLYLSQKRINNIKLKDLISKLENIFDFIIIDTQPNISTLTSLAIQASDLLIIPLESDRYSSKGLNIMVKILKDNFKNKSRKIIAVPVKFNERNNLHKKYLALVDNFLKNIDYLDIKLSNTKISSSTKSASAVDSEHLPIIFSKNKTKQSINLKNQYKTLTDEIINYLK